MKEHHSSHDHHHDNHHEKTLILVVDDSPANLQILGITLEKYGFEVGMAKNGIEALAFVKKELPDLILLDVMMPIMDGYETCKKLKISKKTRNIPVIFLTAKTETDDIVKAFDVGAVDYIRKPFNDRELYVRVRNHLELKRAREEITTLRGILPICMICKKIRNATGYWENVDAYIRKHTEADFSHGICEDCAKEYYSEFLEDEDEENEVEEGEKE